MKTAIIVTIGDEILSGTTVDTNSNFIAEQLKNIGISVKEIRTISDDSATIETIFQWALQNADIVIATGGLGPTKDDKTKKALCQVFDDELYLDPKTYQLLDNYLTQKNRQHLLQLNTDQAVIPSKAYVFQNHYGTAPALMMSTETSKIICLPGVPYEVKPLIKDQIIPYLKNDFTTNYILSKTISVVGVPESVLSEKIESWEMDLPQNIQLSYLPIGFRVKLKLTATGENIESLENQLEDVATQLTPLIGKNIIAYQGDAIEEILGAILIQKKWTISTAESCTGGEIAKLITSVSGSSAYFTGGIIAYDYHKKIEILGVNPETIQNKTVVSEEVANEMAVGCQKLFSTDISISTTGVAGPNTDEFNNEIGKVYYSIRIKDSTITRVLFLPHLERKDFMNFVAMMVLQDVAKTIILGQ